MATNNAVNTSLSGQTGSGAFVGGTAPTLSSPKINQILDSNGNTIFSFTPFALATEYITVTNSTSASNPAFVAAGSATNMSIGMQAKGTGAVRLASVSTTGPVLIASGTGFQHETSFNFADTAASRTVTFPDASGTVAFTSGASGIVNSGLINQLAYYASAGTTVSGLATANSSVLVTNGSGVPSLSTTLPNVALSTPTSGTLTNCTGLPVSTGISGLGTGIATWLATPSSANLLSALTTKTGTGLSVFGTSPTLTTPTIVDSNSANALTIGTTASAVNYLQIFNRAAGAPPYLQPAGTDSDIGILLNLKGAGVFTVATAATSIPFAILSGTGQQHRTNFSFSNTSAIRTVTFPDSDFTIAPTVSPSFTTPSLGAATATSVVFTKVNGTEAANAVTANGNAGVITTSSLTTAGGGSYAITWTNSSITSTSTIFLTLSGGTNTTQNFRFSCVPGSGSATLTIYNLTAATSFNGTMLISYLVC